MNIFQLRERDLLNRFAAEVAQHQAQGVSREITFTLVRMHNNLKSVFTFSYAKYLSVHHQ